MKKIILDGNEIKTLVPESLPMLIHGEEGSGASLYTICLAAKWFQQGYKIHFLCGYSMAEETFKNEITNECTNVTFYTQKQIDMFVDALKNPIQDNSIIIIKNIELFDENVFDLVNKFNNIIISGDISQSIIQKKLMNKNFTTEVYFSSLIGKDIVHLKKYQGLVISKDYKGFTQLAE